MKQMTFAKAGSGMEAAVSTAVGGVWENPKLRRTKTAWMLFLCALIFTTTVFACSGKAQAQSGSGGDAASDLAQAAGAAKDAAGKAAAAVTGGGKPAAAVQPAAASDFVYELNKAGDGVVITGIQKDAKFGANLVVPAEIEGLPVVAYLAWYGDSMSKNRKAPPLVSVVFPDSITYMGRSGIRLYDKNPIGEELEERYGIDKDFWAYDSTYYNLSARFEDYSSIQSIVLPKNLKIIPARLARLCRSLKDVTLPQALEVIGEEAFSDTALTKLAIPNGVRHIGNAAFSISAFTELVIPEGIKVIGEGMFAGCKALTSVTIPDSIEEIGAGAFNNCAELAAVKLPAHSIKYPKGRNSEKNDAFAYCPKLGLAAQKVISDTGYPDF
jgi:hypothetical protein